MTSTHTPEAEDCSYLVDDPAHLTDEQVAEIREGIKRGLEAEAAGRVKSLTQAVAEARQWHGSPPTWASGPITMR